MTEDVLGEQQLRLEEARYFLQLEKTLAVLHEDLRRVMRAYPGSPDDHIARALEAALYGLGGACLAASIEVSTLRADVRFCT